MNNQVKLGIISILIVIPLSSFAIWATDSHQNFEKSDNSKLQVISSFYPLFEFSQKVGQNKIDASLLVPIGVEPHDWEPTIQDVQQLQQSDIIVINGIGFESWVDNLESMNYKGQVIDTSQRIFQKDSNQILEQPSDPHIWLNPVLAKIQVQTIADTFSNLDPENKKYFQDNASNYIVQLDLLDSKIRDSLSNCTRDFIAFHDAFSYFADEYNLIQHTIISSNDPHAEVTAKTLEKVITTAKNFNQTIIFSEETTDSKTSKVIANEIDGKVLVLSPLEIGIDNFDYIQRMEQNLENLKEALCN